MDLENYQRNFSFIIPEEAIPSYAGKDASVVYALATWVDIPHWPDARAKMPFFVTAQSIAYPVIPGGLQYSSEEGETETAGERPVIELRMERKGFYPGEKIPCTVRITNQAKKKLRKLTASLLAVEHTRALSYTGVAIPETHKTEIDLPKEQDILEFPIYLPIPKGVRSSYEGKLTRLEWQLNLKLDVALGKDVSLKCPIAIHGPQKVDKDRFAELTKTLKFMM